MRKALAVIATMVGILAASTGVSASYNQDTLTIDPSDMKLIWSDEFEGDALNTNNWTYEIGNGNWGWGNNEQEYYTSSTDNVYVNNGTLKISARKQSVGGKNYTSGRIKTAGKVEVGNGYVVAKIKLPSAKGIWPAFWMLGTNGQTWPMCGEIDIMESINTNQFPYATMHWTTVAAPTKDHYESKFPTAYGFPNFDKTQWHTYGVYRTDDKIRVFYDNQLIGYYTYVAGMEELKDNYYMLLNVAVGGNLTSNQLPATSALPATMEVDYVRYYRDKTAQDIADEKEQAAKEEAAKKAAAAKAEAAKKAAAAKAEAEKKAKAKPARATVKSTKNVKGRKVSLTIKKIKDAKGYQIRYCDNKRFQGYIQKNTTKTKYTLKRLEKKSTCYVKVRAYKVYKGKKIYGSWSKVKRVKIKK